MTDELTRLLDLPALARLSIAGDEIALLTLNHEHADEVTIKRRKLGPSIDLGDLLQLIGAHGLAELPPSQIQVSEIAALQLPAPVEEAAAPIPTTRRTTKHHTPALACSSCSRTFANNHALDVHRGRAHKAPKTPAVDPLQARAARRRMEQAPPEPEPAVPEPQTFACPDCPRTFRSQSALDNHVAMIHWQNEAASPVVQTEGICDVCRRPEGLHDRCVDCGMLLGDEHTAGPVHIRINGKPLCASCDAYRGAGRLVRAS